MGGPLFCLRKTIYGNEQGKDFFKKGEKDEDT
jgi:hypothetical protein